MKRLFIYWVSNGWTLRRKVKKSVEDNSEERIELLKLTTSFVMRLPDEKEGDETQCQCSVAELQAGSLNGREKIGKC